MIEIFASNENVRSDENREFCEGAPGSQKQHVTVHVHKLHRIFHSTRFRPDALRHFSSFSNGNHRISVRCRYITGYVTKMSSSPPLMLSDVIASHRLAVTQNHNLLFSCFASFPRLSSLSLSFIVSFPPFRRMTSFIYRPLKISSDIMFPSRASPPSSRNCCCCCCCCCCRC